VRTTGDDEVAEVVEVTIVVVPRDKYRRAWAVLQHLLSMEAPPFALVWVDEARSPRRLRRRISAEAHRRGFRHLPVEHRAGANECRARGLEVATTPYVLLLDNDAFPHDGALSALLACARQTRASFVAPVCLYSDGGVHHAGSGAHLADDGGERRLVEVRRPHGVRLDLIPELARSRADGPELHGVLVRRSSVIAAGGLDAGLSSSMDCTDLGLRLADLDGGGWFEPDAVVTYDDAGPRPLDLPLYVDRWSRATVEHDIARFTDRWGLQPSDARVEEHRQHLLGRRRRLVRYPRAVIRRALGDGALHWFDGAVDAALDRFSDARDPGTDDRRATS
jgi:GT2 family glycosyltransferase